MPRGWKISVVSVLAFGALGLTACSDDEPANVTQQAYDDEASSLCEEHAADMLAQQEALQNGAVSGAEEASFYVAEFVPRMRAIIRSLDSFGYPVENAAVYNAAAQDGMQALADIEADAIGLIDRRDAGLLVDDENPFIDLDEALAALDVPC